MRQLRRDLKLQPLQKSWSPERIEQQALEFYRTEGQLTHALLYKKKRSDLWNAISRRYPGGMQKLQDRLEITPDRKIRGFWKIDVIEQEALIFFSDHHDLNQNILTQHGRVDLASAIKRTYPGGFQGLRENLRLRTTKLNSKNTISPDQANEELMRFLEAKDEQ